MDDIQRQTFKTMNHHPLFGPEPEGTPFLTHQVSKKKKETLDWSKRRREFRPLMKDMDIKGFSQLLKKRRQYYIESSIATIDIDKKNIDEVVDWIKNNEKNHF